MGSEMCIRDRNNACNRTYYGYLIAKFVFLMFFTLADTLYFRFMNGIYLFPAITSLGKNGLKEFEQFVVVVILFKITLQLPD